MPKGVKGEVGKHTITTQATGDFITRVHALGIPQPMEWLARAMGVSLASLYRYKGGHSELGIEASMKAHREISKLELERSIRAETERAEAQPGAVTSYGWTH